MATTDLQLRNALVEKHGMEFVIRRRKDQEPEVLFDLREINKHAGKDMFNAMMFATATCDRSRFMGLTQEEIAKELLRLEMEGYPDPPEGERTTSYFAGANKSVWTGKSGGVAPVSVSLSLEAFFDGNFDEQSIAKKSPELERPPLREIAEALHEIRDREDVAEARVVIEWWPDPEEPREDERWPRASGFFLWTWGVRATKAKKWFEPLNARVTEYHHHPWITHSPKTKVGMRILFAHWK